MILYLFLILALIFFAIGTYFTKAYYHDKKQKYSIVKGKIIGFENCTKSKLNSFFPIVQYYYKNSEYKIRLKMIHATIIDESVIIPDTKLKTGDIIDLKVYDNVPSKAVRLSNIGKYKNMIFAIIFHILSLINLIIGVISHLIKK